MAPAALVALALAVLTLPRLTPAWADPPDTTKPATRDYVIVEGDTCLGIAIRQIGDRKALGQLHALNDLGPLPHKLVPGQVIRLPIKEGAADAELTSALGLVNVRRAATGAWDAARRGMDLFRNWRVRSQQHSSAKVTFRDDSVITMRENTVVIIYGPAARTAVSRQGGATLESGALRSRLAELGGKLVVTTESAEVGLGPGSALVSVDPTGVARVSNHLGKDAKVRRRRRGRAVGKGVEVGAGMGLRVAIGAEPTPPEPLPPSPVWRKVPALAVGWQHLGVSVSGHWQPVSAAKTYRVEITRDTADQEVVAAVEVPANVDSFVVHRLPAGDYRVQVAAIDQNGMESAPSKAAPFKAETIALEGVPAPDAVGPDAARAAVDPKTPPPRQALKVGDVVRLPQGLSCTLDQRPATTGSIVIAQGGAQELRCSGPAGKNEPFLLAVAESKGVAPREDATTGEVTADRGPLAAPPSGARAQLAFGCFGGYLSPAFNQEGTERQGAAPSFGWRLGFRPGGRFAIELDATVAYPDVDGASHSALHAAPLLVFEHALAAALVGRARAGFLLHRGFDAADDAQKWRAGFQGGIGAGYALSPTIDLRADATYALGPELPQTLGLTLGLDFLLGR